MGGLMRPVVRTVGFTIKKDIVALVQKKTYVDHNLSYRRIGEEPPRRPLIRQLFWCTRFKAIYSHP